MAAIEFSNYNISQDLISALKNLKNKYSYYNFSSLDDSTLTVRESIIILSYAIIVIISIFGNLLVCNIVVRKASLRRPTYIFIANLALSDLLMTVLNIPFNVARVLLTDWPFGDFMCSFVPLVQVISVYVSTFTMMFIALDRYRVICNPLMPRLSALQATKVVVLVWLIAIVLSLPHAICNRVETIFTYRIRIRCRTVYPEGLSKWIMLITFLTQYVLPLSVTVIAYIFIVARVWSRDILGVVTQAQLITQVKAKRKTIKMLVLVVIFFAVCWLPLNIYHLLYEFIPSIFTNKTAPTFYKSTIYFMCHWLAMSSVCGNPFIYCWLNKNFRSGALACFLCMRNVGRKLNTSFRSTREFRLTDMRGDFTSQSYDSRTDSIQQTRDVSCCCNSPMNQQPMQKSKSLCIGTKEQFGKESIPMKTFTAKLSNISVSISDEENRNEFYSVPEMETVFIDTKNTTRYPLKKCISWNQ